MRLSKFLLTVLFLTSFCLLYVYQETEIFRLGYLGQKRQARLDDLLDKNTILRYNITKGTSLVRIGDKISGSSDFQMPETFRLVRMAPSKTSTRIKEAPPEKQTLLTRVFGIKRQAEANTINATAAFRAIGNNP